MPGNEHGSLEPVPPLDLPDALARIRVPARGDRPERVLRLHDVAPLWPRCVGGAGKRGPDKDPECDDDEDSTEHVFAMMHEHVFAVKSLEFCSVTVWRRLKDFAWRVLLRRTSMHD